MKGLSGLFSCLVDKSPHLTSSESQAKPLFSLASGDGLPYAHTVTDFLLFRSWECVSRLRLARLGTHLQPFQPGLLLPACRAHLPHPGESWHPGFALSKSQLNSSSLPALPPHGAGC